jgi:DNA-directed RNA polymerase specialized sigma24 family protein
MQSQDRVEKLLALLLIHELKTAPQRDRALHLSMAGFTNTEIADLLQTTTGVVAQCLYEARRKPKRKAGRTRAEK